MKYNLKLIADMALDILKITGTLAAIVLTTIVLPVLCLVALG